MKRAILLLACCGAAFLVSTSAVAVEPQKGPATSGAPPDVLGWQKTRWGMLDAEVRSLYRGELPKSIQLFGEEFSVKFHFDDKKQLNLVSLIHVSEPSVSDQGPFAEKVLGTLISKYGKGRIVLEEHHPKKLIEGLPGGFTTRTPGSDKATIQWIFPSTMITFDRVLFDLGAAPGDIEKHSVVVIIVYEPSEKGKL